MCIYNWKSNTGHIPFKKDFSMVQGLYLGAQGMTCLVQKQEQISNNLANINTTGYKQSGLFLQSYEKYLANDKQEPFVNSEIKSDEVYIDFKEGPMRQTGGNLDCMISGSGFFNIMTPQGVRYSRNGSFSLDKDGYMVTNDGNKVIGKDGYIRLEKTAAGIVITEEGEVYQEDQLMGKIKISDFPKPYKMSREGNSCFRPLLPENPEVPSPGFAVHQGFLEASNINVIHNMVQMISAARNYEADQKAIQAQSDTLEKSVNMVGRLN
jgi:flagellar basal-body rod protein FlgG